MASELAKVYGTEADKIHCPFYYKIGACMYGNYCSRQHVKPTASPTVLIPHMYQNPLSFEGGNQYPPEVIQQNFEEFFEDVFLELSKFGHIVGMYVPDNICPHLIGNVYVKYSSNGAAQRCVDNINGRSFGGQELHAELSPVTEFREALCRQFEKGQCVRGGQCNFIHAKKIRDSLYRKLFHHQRRHSRSPSSSSRSSSSSDSSDSFHRRHRKSKHRSHKNRTSSRDRSRSRSKSKSKASEHRHHEHRSSHKHRSDRKHRTKESPESHDEPSSAHH